MSIQAAQVHNLSITMCNSWQPAQRTGAEVAALGQAIVHGVGPKALVGAGRGGGGVHLGDGGVVQEPWESTREPVGLKWVKGER